MGEFNRLCFEIEGRVYCKKNSRRIGYRGGRMINFPSKNFENFKESALWQLKKVKGRLKPPYSVRYLFYIKGKMDADLDNLIASVNDVLQDAGVIENDRLIHEAEAKKVMGQKDFKTTIEILEI